MKRYEELDSMRGIAAFAVIISHSLAIFAQPNNFLDATPLYFLWSSHEAVIFFFVLSGFVLSFPFLKGKQVFSEFLIKRIIRIYAPYIVAILFTFIMYIIFANKYGFNGLDPWVQNKWVGDLTINDVLNHILLIGNYETTTYNPVIWSLIHEVRISIIFPLIIFAVVKLPQKYVLLIGVILSLLGLSNKIFHFQVAIGSHTSIFDSLHYMFMFLIGAILAKNREFLINKYRNLYFKRKVILLLIGFTFYLYSRVLYAVPHILNYDLLTGFMYGISEWGISVGSAILIIIVLGSQRVALFLQRKSLVLNGKLSYSTYLYHTTILFTMFSIFNSKINNWLILVVSLILTYFLSYISWKYIETTSIILGKKIISLTNSFKVKKIKIDKYN